MTVSAAAFETLYLPRLTRADIVLVSYDSLLAYMIRRAQGRLECNRAGGGPWNHVALYIGDGLIEEAEPPRVRIKPLYEMCMNAAEVEIWHYRPWRKNIEISDGEANPLPSQAVVRALQLAGTRYDFLGIVGQFLASVTRWKWLSRFVNKKNQLYCSELILEIYNEMTGTLFGAVSRRSATPDTIGDSLRASPMQWERVLHFLRGEPISARTEERKAEGEAGQWV